MNHHSMFRQNTGSGNFPPPPPPPPPGFDPSPQQHQSTNYNTVNTGSASSNAVIALVLGILSFIACSILSAIPAWIVGKKELNAIDAGRSPQAGRTMAKIGMWLGIINVILFIIGMIFVAFAVMLGLFNMDDYR